MSKIIVCSCEDVALGEVYSALRQGFTDIESLKRYTGIGTGKCQGKCCFIQTLRVLASTSGQQAIQDGSPNGPGEPFIAPDATELARHIRIPTIRQPVTPLAIDDIVDAGENERDQ